MRENISDIRSLKKYWLAAVLSICMIEKIEVHRFSVHTRRA